MAQPQAALLPALRTCRRQRAPVLQPRAAGQRNARSDRDARSDEGRLAEAVGLAGAIALDVVDAHYERARAAGAEIVRPIAEQPYGSREYAARDLEGNTWHFGTYRPTVSP